MDDDATDQAGQQPRLRAHWQKAAILGVALAGLALAVVACSDSSSTTGGEAGTSSGSSAYQAAVRYASCMRSHGESSFPDPNSQGKFIFSGTSLDQSSSQYQSANQSCEKLLPDGGQTSSGQSQSITENALKYASCMRSHGESSFPDPSTNSGGEVIIGSPNIDPNTPQYQHAAQACQSILGNRQAPGATP
jgi:hypothetical protein